VRVLALDTSTYDGVFGSLAAVGRELGEDERARILADGMRGALDDVRRQAAGVPRRSVLFVVGRDPLYVAGPGSHADEMIALAGGENVAHDTASPYARISLEAVLARMPQVIIDTSDNRPAAERGRIAGDWARWAFLPAVRDRRVWQVDPGRLVIPGIRLPEMTRLVGRLVHPEVFGEPEPGEIEAPAN
jgi:iron complex transport system substrate-binding protein